MDNHVHNELKVLRELCDYQILSSGFVEESRRINIFMTVFIIIIGLLGNSFACLTFLQKHIRSNTTSVYLLCLTTSDNLYLLAHFFEYTVKTYTEHYVHKTDFIHEECRIQSILNDTNNTELNLNKNQLDRSFAKAINIIDKYDFLCRFINFGRYFLRFTSAYIIVAFTVQRTRAIRSPLLRNNLESKRVLKLIAFIILFFGSLSAIWIPFIL